MRHASFAIVVFVVSVTVASVRAQTVELAKTETAYFTIDLPPAWRIEAVAPEDKQSKEREFEVISADAKKVFTVTVAIDAPRFIECFCVPWRAYKRYKKDGLKNTLR